jgi:peptide deformylase
MTPKTKLTILEYPDPRLRKTALPVQVVDDAVRQLAADLLETMYSAKGVGLAATQVDIHRRVIALDVSDERNRPLILINPELLEATGRGPGEEGCLSLPDIYEKVQRATHIRVRALGRDGQPFELEADGLLAVCIQHEMDHLEGKLFVDYLSELKRRLIRRRLEKDRKQRAPSDARPTAVGSASPSGALFGTLKSGAAVSGAAAPGAAAPGRATPTGVATPGVATPGVMTRSLATRGGANSLGAAPGASAPGATAPGASAPGASALGASAPGATARVAATPAL